MKKEKLNMYDPKKQINTALYDISAVSPLAILFAAPKKYFSEFLNFYFT